jgi:hypothetical protein
MYAADLIKTCAKANNLPPEIQIILITEFLVDKLPGVQGEVVSEKLREILEAVGVVPDVVIDVIGALLDRYAATKDLPKYLKDFLAGWATAVIPEPTNATIICEVTAEEAKRIDKAFSDVAWPIGVRMPVGSVRDTEVPDWLSCVLITLIGNSAGAPVIDISLWIDDKCVASGPPCYSLDEPIRVTYRSVCVEIKFVRLPEVQSGAPKEATQGST